MMTVEAENDCPICQETLHGNISVGCTVPCGHLFHRTCFATWQVHSSSKKCPSCNAKLKGFIEKIHITLPASSSNLLEDPEIILQRRKALSNEKAKRSAMMRHKDRRRLSTNLMGEVYERDEGEDKSRNCEVARKCVSLSASLQRVPQDPVKNAEMLHSETVLPEEDPTRLLGINSALYDDDMFIRVEHLEDQIPDVAEKIMRNIERTLRQNHSIRTPLPPKTSDRCHPTERIPLSTSTTRFPTTIKVVKK